MKGRRNLMQTFTAYQVQSVQDGKVKTSNGVHPLLSTDPKVQRGWFRVISDNTDSVEYMTEKQMDSKFYERDTY